MQFLFDNEGALHHRSVDACQGIRNYLGIFEMMLRSTMKRVESRGGHFEHLL
jgi:aspartate oxidase